MELTSAYVCDIFGTVKEGRVKLRCFFAAPLLGGISVYLLGARNYNFTLANMDRATPEDRWRWKWEKSNNFWGAYFLLLRSHLYICSQKRLKCCLSPSPNKGVYEHLPHTALPSCRRWFQLPKVYGPAAARWATFMIAEFLFLIRRAGNCGHLCFIYLVFKCFLHEFLFSAAKINGRRWYLCPSKTFCRLGGSSLHCLYAGLK